MHGLQITVIDSSQALVALRDEWDGLCARSDTAHFFHSFTWCWQIWQSVAMVRGRRLHIIICRLDGELVLIWPLMIAGRVLRMLSSDTLEYRDIIVKNDSRALKWMRAAWRVAKRTSGADLFILQNILAPSNLNALLCDVDDAHPTGGGSCRVLRLHRYENWESFARRLPKSMVSDQRRQWTRAKESIPSLAFKLLDDPEEIARMIQWMLHHKSEWLHAKEKGNQSFRTAEIQHLLHHGALNAHQQGKLVCAHLGNATTTISAGFGYKFGDQFLFHVFAYDMSYGRLSPSRLFLECLVRWCMENKVHTFDFMPGGEAYKSKWADDSVRTDSYAGPLTLWGRVLWKWHTKHANRFNCPESIKAFYDGIPLPIKHGIRSGLARSGLLLDLELSLRKSPLRYSGSE